MSVKELFRIDVLTRVLDGKVTAKQAADVEQVSLRQVRRQIRTLRTEGAEALVHGSRGRISPRRLPEPLRERICTLLREEYTDYTCTRSRR
jgi:transposase